jgi:protein involved in polysaccharide export with SLBB domain
MIFHKLFRPAIALCAASLIMSGCASYKDLPAGTRQQISAKPDAVESPSPTLLPPQAHDYRIGPNDVLFVNVSGKPEFTSGAKGYRVDGRGCIYLPIAGKVAVSGLPLFEVRERISSVMREYFNNPWVVVEIAEYRTRQIFVFGAVKKSGPLTIPAAGVTLVQAIASADVQDRGSNLQKVRIIRSNSPTDGELLVVDLDSMLRGKAMPMQLQEGDVIYVPKSAFIGWNEAITELLPSLQMFSAVMQPYVTIKYLTQ